MREFKKAVRRFFTLIFFVLFPILIAGCAATGPSLNRIEKKNIQKEMQRKSIDFFCDKMVEIHSVGYKLLQNLPDTVAEGRYAQLPFIYVDLDSNLQDIYGTPSSQGVMVVGLLEGFGASGLELKRGDELILLEEKPVKSESNLRLQLKKIANTEEVTIRLRRESKEWNEKIPVIYLKRKVPFILNGNSHDIRAQANDSGTIYLTSGLLHFIENKDELAFVLAHEIAHLTENHFQNLSLNEFFGFSDKITYGMRLKYYTQGKVSEVMQDAYGAFSTRFSSVQEWEADHIGLRYVAQAGFDVDKAVMFLERLVIETSGASPNKNKNKGIVPSPQRVFRAKKAAEEFRSASKELLQNNTVSSSPQRKENNSKTETALAVIDQASFGIDETGLAEDVDNLWLTGKVDGKINFFSADTEKIVWYAKIENEGFKVRPNKFRVEWYDPQGELHTKDQFNFAFGNARLAKTILKLRLPLDTEATGRWRVRVWLGGDLIDDRYFWIGSSTKNHEI